MLPGPEALQKPKGSTAQDNSRRISGQEFEFQLLIGELNSHFRCLTQRITDLTHENADLRLQAASVVPAKPAPALRDPRRNESREFFEDLQSSRNSEANRVQPEDCNFKQLDASEAPKMDSKWKSQVVMQERASTVSKESGKKVQLQTRSVEHLDEAPEAPKKMRESKWKASQVNMQDLQLPNIISWDGSGDEVARSRSEFASKITSTIDHIRLFDTLDVGHKGKLSVQDLMTIMERTSEAATHEILVSVVQQLTGDLGTGMEASNAGLDVRAFQQLMDGRDEGESDGLDSPRESCKAALRRACQASRAKVVRPTHQHATATKQNERKKTCFERYAPLVLESLPPMVILLNTLVAGLSVDHPEQEDLWDIAEYIFVALYTMEFLAKIRLYGCHGFWNGKDRWWNIFDFVCLSVSLADLSVKIAVSIFVPGDVDSGGTLFLMIKILRLSRLARLVRTLRFHFFQELKMMVLGVVSGMRVLTWAIVLLCMLIYLVGVGTTNLLGKNEPEFKDMRSSMFTLFRCWTEGCAAYDGTPLAERLRADYGFVWMCFHILITMFVTVGIFNLIMAIFIDNVVTSQLMRKHSEMVERTPEIMARFKHLFAGFIKDGTGKAIACGIPEKPASGCWGMLRFMGDGGKNHIDMKAVDKEWEILRRMNIAITKEVFQDWLEDEGFRQLLDEADIDVASRNELFDVLDSDMGGELSMDELTTGLMKLRGAVTKSDIVAIRLKVRYLTSILESRLDVS